MLIKKPYVCPTRTLLSFPSPNLVPNTGPHNAYKNKYKLQRAHNNINKYFLEISCCRKLCQTKKSKHTIINSEHSNF